MSHSQPQAVAMFAPMSLLPLLLCPLPALSSPSSEAPPDSQLSASEVEGMRSQGPWQDTLVLPTSWIPRSQGVQEVEHLEAQAGRLVEAAARLEGRVEELSRKVGNVIPSIDDKLLKLVDKFKEADKSGRN